MLSFFKKKSKNIELKAYLSGRAIPVTEVSDGIFSEKMMGDGIAIWPSSNTVVAPSDGTIAAVMDDSKHAVGIRLENGVEILIHIGLDTVEMEGKGFELFVKLNDKVKCGDKLIVFDREEIKKAGYQDVVIMVMPEKGSCENIDFVTGTEVVVGESVIATLK